MRRVEVTWELSALHHFGEPVERLRVLWAGLRCVPSRRCHGIGGGACNPIFHRLRRLDSSGAIVRTSPRIL